MHFVLTYDLCADYLTRREPHRQAHLALAWQAVKRGELLLGGPMADVADGAMLLFQGDSDAAARSFATTDPYVVHGVVTRWQVRRWNTVVGEAAASPVRLD